MKVLLINPPVSGIKPEYLQMCEPLGLAYLSAVLSNHKHDVTVLDFYALGKGKIIKDGNIFRKGLNDEEMFEALDRVSPDIIGITCNFSMFFKDSYNVARLCKIKYKDRMIILGGSHAVTMTPADLERNKFIDIIVRGEGEEVLLEIVDKYGHGRDIQNINGTFIKQGERIITNPDRDLISDLDTIPLPAREYLDMDFYLNHSDVYGYHKKLPTAYVITSRGCPFNCIFCTVKGSYGRSWRAYSINRVLDEIRGLVKNYGVKEICFYDDNISVDKKRLVNICHKIIDEKMDISIRISSGMPVQSLDYELLKMLKKAGLYRIVFPIESGCEKTQKFIRKNVDLVKAKEKIRIANRLGLWTHGNFIIGFPYETKEDIKQTRDYAENSGLDYVSYLIAQPFRVSELHKIYQQEGLLNDNSIDPNSRFTETKYNTKYFTAERLQYIRDKLASRYIIKKFLNYLNPVVFFVSLYPKINNWEGIKYVFKLLRSKQFLRLVFNKQKI